MQQKVNVWNPTIANLSLMALGSSAPEILLSVIETLLTLGKLPGELGPSTIVGSAAFNLLIISGVSVFVVTEENDNRSEEQIASDGTPKGVKKILDMGVFTITTTFSLWAYVWLYICLLDGVVTQVEAWVTFGFFWLLLVIAYIADKINEKRMKARLDSRFGVEATQEEHATGPKHYSNYTPVEFY